MIAKTKKYGENVQKTETCHERTERQNDIHNNAAPTRQNSDVTASTA
jgi:hypothetical protein